MSNFKLSKNESQDDKLIAEKVFYSLFFGVH